MRHYIIEATVMKDGSCPKAIYLKEDRNQAIMQFHQTLASAMSNDKVESCLCMVINEYGNTEIADRYEVEQPEPEPNEEG